MKILIILIQFFSISSKLMKCAPFTGEIKTKMVQLSKLGTLHSGVFACNFFSCCKFYSQNGEFELI